MKTESRKEKQQPDVGKLSISDNLVNADLKSTRKEILEQILRIMGTTQATRRRFECALP